MAVEDPIEMLVREHEIILNVMKALGQVADAMKRGTKCDVELLRDAVLFMCEFADRIHHSKEEDLLFPALHQKGIPNDGGPIGAMKIEHEQARALVASFTEAVEAYAGQGAPAADAVCAVIRNIVALYPDHIWKENNILYPMAMKVLTPGELDELGRQFVDVDGETDPAVLSGFAEFAGRLELKSAPG